MNKSFAKETVPKTYAAQQSVHWTLGILRHFQAFFWLRVFPVMQNGQHIGKVFHDGNKWGWFYSPNGTPNKACSRTHRRAREKSKFCKSGAPLTQNRWADGRWAEL